MVGLQRFKQILNLNGFEVKRVKCRRGEIQGIKLNTLHLTDIFKAAGKENEFQTWFKSTVGITSHEYNSEFSKGDRQQGVINFIPDERVNEFEAKESVTASNLNERVLRSKMIELKREKAVCKKEMRRMVLELQKRQDTILQLRTSLVRRYFNSIDLGLVDDWMPEDNTTTATQNHEESLYETELQHLTNQHHNDLVHEIEIQQLRNVIRRLEGELIVKEDKLQTALCCQYFNSIDLGFVNAWMPGDNSRAAATQTNDEHIYNSVELKLVDAWAPEDINDVGLITLR